MYMFAFLLLCFMSMFAYLDLDFAMLCAFCGLVLVGLLRPLACVVAYVPLVDHLDVTTCVIHLRGVGVLDTHVSLLHAMFICYLPCLGRDLYLCVLRAMFMCLDLHVGCYAMCFHSLFVS